MRVLLTVPLLLSVAGGARVSAQDLWSVSSPDGRNTITVARKADGRVAFRLARDNQPLLAASPLGIRRADQTFDAGLPFVSESPVRTIDERYTMPFGKRKEIGRAS